MIDWFRAAVRSFAPKPAFRVSSAEIALALAPEMSSAILSDSRPTARPPPSTLFSEAMIFVAIGVRDRRRRR